MEITGEKWPKNQKNGRLWQNSKITKRMCYIIDVLRTEKTCTKNEERRKKEKEENEIGVLIKK